ncbi:MAG: hypothetical protein C0391_08705 [Anaerolinea sp.]|nr:hypothetical protein [Anaerolinea sp.]
MSMSLAISSLLILFAALSFTLVILLRRWAKRLLVMDIPNERSSHSIPTPRGGGLAIVLITLVVILLYNLISGEWRDGVVYLTGGLILAVLGWRDDMKSLPAWVRFLVQGLVAVGTIIGLGYFDTLPFPFIGHIPLGIFGVLITFMWIIGMTNAFNFMDGIDGIAAGVAFIGGIGWMVLVVSGLGAVDSQPFWIALAVAGASLGFLIHNWQPAKIFMGDVCSGFLGYTFAVLPLLMKGEPSQPFMSGILLMWVIILDAGVTFIRRAYKREKLFSAHRSHLYQRMVSAGYSHAAVSTTFILLSMLGLAMALGWFRHTGWAQWVILLGIPVFWAGFSYLGPRRHLWVKSKAYLSLLENLGLDWMLFRIQHAIQEKLGYLRHNSPANAWKDSPLASWVKAEIPTNAVGYKHWRDKHAPVWFYQSIPGMPAHPAWDPKESVYEAEKVLLGEWKFFSHSWIKTGFPPDWHFEPFSGTRFESSKHWSEIAEYGDYDIKFAWETSRLSMVFTLVRAYSAVRDARYPAAYWQLVEDWMEQNPPNQGVNWIGGQEAALRLLALCFGWYAFRDAAESTPERVASLTCLAGALGARMEHNLDFALHTGNNHAISEPFGLWLCGTIFPELKKAEKYREIGRKHFNQQGLKQLFADGGYAMYSINYQRFVLQVCALALRLGELHGKPFSPELVAKMARSAEFLRQLVEESSGAVPAYGSNDGALVLPLNTCDYRDYRPVLQLTHFCASGKRLLTPGPWDEDLFWLFGAEALSAIIDDEPTEKKTNFPQAGVYVLHGECSRAYIRCTEFQSRPSHADQLHVDLWYDRINLACDAGTYLYHGAGIWQNGLASTSAHNSVMVDDEDQMVHLSRFTWGIWSRGRVMNQAEQNGMTTWQGCHTGYHRLGDPVTHTRRVHQLPGDIWLVEDRLTGRQRHKYTLHWLLADLPYQEIESSQGYTLELKLNARKLRMILGPRDSGDLAIVRAGDATRGWRSNYYGQKEPAISVSLTCRKAAQCFWTIFMPEPQDISEESIKNILKYLDN